MLRRNFDPQKPYRYICYGRMSSDSQNPRSPEQQFDTITQTLHRRGLPWVHVGDFRDDAKSGRLLRTRQGLQEMLRAIKTGTLRVDLILVDTFERFGRADELAAIRADLNNAHGVLILTADSNFTDPTSVAGRALTFVEQVRSTEDGRVKAHNVLRGKRDLIRQKKAWPGGTPPLGLMLKSVMKTGKNGGQEVDHNILVPNPETAWVVARIFETAKQTGWGTSRLSNFFNRHASIPEKLKPISTSIIGYVLDNPIYYGELLWERHATGIVNDTRVVERNLEEDMLRIPDFCEPIVPRELWMEVQDLREKRRKHARRTQDDYQVDAKQIKPLAPGLTLKHLLTGLVRCGHCGASMRPSPSKFTARTGKVWRRLYYACPIHVSGSCPNGLYVREDKLREWVVARLRSRLFPVPEQAGQVPDWFVPLVEDVREELQRRAKEQPDQRPAWEKEVTDLQERVSGWAISLANPKLDSSLRADIEAQYGATKARIAQLEGSLAEQGITNNHVEEILDPDQVLHRLHRLADILAGGNPTLGNLELSLHIDRIDCFVDGKVEMRSSQLGAFEGAIELLRRSSEPTTAVADDDLVVIKRVNPRRRARHRIEDDPTHHSDRSQDSAIAIRPDRFDGLEDRWFWRDSMETQQASSWSEEYAAEVLELRLTGKTHEELAKHFGRSIPTIRRALKLALKKDSTMSVPRKMPRRRWHEEHALEVADLKAEGLTTLEIAVRLEKSDTTIRAAIHYAKSQSHGGSPLDEVKEGLPSSDEVEE